MTAIVQTLLGHSGVWLLLVAFAVVMLESSAFLGVIFPGETVALLVGALAGGGVLRFWWAFAAVAGGAVLGDIGGYVLGRWKGEAILERWAFARRQHERYRGELESYFARWGATTVLIGRFVAVGRAFAPFTAGLYQMRARRFVPMAIFAGLLWGAVVVALGYFVGANWKHVETWLSSLGLGIFILFVLTIAAVVLWRWLLRRQDRLRAVWERRIAEPYGLELEPIIAFARRRLSPGGYLGLHLTVGVIVLVALAWLFGGVVQDIFAQDPLVRVDQAVAAFVAARRTPALDYVMATPIFLGRPWALVVVAALATAGLARAAEKVMAVAALPVAASAYGAGIGLRALFTLFSPAVPPSQVVHGFHGFPSLTMVMATTVYGLLCYTVAIHGRSWRLRTLGGVAALYVLLLIGMGAVYRGLPLSAVIGGFAAGGCWLAICITGILTYEKLRT
jgi:membrane protein DedA with SNARE-associated domain